MGCGNAGDVVYHDLPDSTNMLSFLKISTYMLGVNGERGCYTGTIKDGQTQEDALGKGG